MKLLINFLTIIVFVFGQTFPFRAHANKYMDQAVSGTSEYNDILRETAKNAVVVQYSNIMKNLFYGSTPEKFDEALRNLDGVIGQIYADVVQVTHNISKHSIDDLKDDELSARINEIITNTSNFSTLIGRFSWIVRDQMDGLIATEDWLVQSIKAFHGRCQLGYINPLSLGEIQAQVRPPNFNANVNVFLGFSKELEGTEGIRSDISHTEVSALPENYADDPDLKTLSDIAEFNTYALGASSAFYVSALAAGGNLVLVTPTATTAGLSVSASALGAVAATSLAIGVAVAVAIIIVGSRKAYKEQKKWAQAEMFKFFNVLDSDDFSSTYRDECQKFDKKLEILMQAFVNYRSDQVFREKIDNEIWNVRFGECYNYLSLVTPKKEDDDFDSEDSVNLLKYYQCATRVHGPKLFQENFSQKISDIQQKIEILREYLGNLVELNYNRKDYFAQMIKPTEVEIRIDRLFKNYVLVSTGVLVNVSTLEEYTYHKSILENDLKNLKKEDLILIDLDSLRKNVKEIDQKISQYNKIM